MTRRLRFLAAAMVSACYVNSAPVQAAFTFLGPTPYLSAADSPFDLSGLGTTFFLEDFEDTTITPGMEQLPNGYDIQFGGLGSSVDLDDGTLDGTGQNGYSLGLTNINDSGAALTLFIRLDFDASQLGFLPTAVGFALTDGGGPHTWIAAEDGLGRDFFYSTEHLLLSPTTTTDDRFIGLANPAGIAHIAVGVSLPYVQPLPRGRTPLIDHLQYGLIVPEPASSSLLAFAGVSLFHLLKR